MLQEFNGKDSFSKFQFFRWNKAFNDGRVYNDDEQSVERLSSSRNAYNVTIRLMPLIYDRQMNTE